jgi:phage baseplate assembly protein W
MSEGRHLAFPFGIGSDGRSLSVDTRDKQVLQELEQLVLTNPGERLFLPAFGGGATRLLFESTDDNTISIAKATLTQAIQTWLADRVNLLSVDVSSSGSMMSIVITYQVVGSASTSQAVFQRSSP